MNVRSRNHANYKFQISWLQNWIINLYIYYFHRMEPKQQNGSDHEIIQQNLFHTKDYPWSLLIWSEIEIHT